MVKIRLKRIGSKFNAYYRIIIADARAPRDGRFIEEIGTYDPYKKNVFIKEENQKKWLDKGAVPTNIVKILFKEYKIAKEKGNFQGNLVTLIKKPKKTKTKKEIKDENVVKENQPEKNQKISPNEELNQVKSQGDNKVEKIVSKNNEEKLSK